MTALDIFVIILLGGGALLGFVRGFVQEVLSLFAWVAAILAVKFGMPHAVEFLADYFRGSSWPLVAAFTLLFFPTFLIVRTLARRIGKRTRRSIIGPVDRFLGGGFGMLKGLVAATVMYLVANLVTDLVAGPDADRPSWMENSQTFPLLNASSDAVIDLVGDLRETTSQVTDA